MAHWLRKQAGGDTDRSLLSAQMSPRAAVPAALGALRDSLDPVQEIRRIVAIGSVAIAGVVASARIGIAQDTPSLRDKPAADIPAQVTVDAAAAGVQATARAERRALLTAAERTAGEVAAYGRSAFQRGLMPLPDYLEQSALVTLIETESADAQGAIRSAAWQRQANRLREARDRLQRFGQPASEGWGADLALAEWALADAEFSLATTTEDPVALQAASERRAMWAAEHLRRRQADAHIGAASRPAVTNAMSLVVDSRDRDGAGRSGFELEYQSELRRVEQLTAVWAEQGAGIGRTDRLIEARLAVNIDSAVATDANGDVVIDRAAFDAANSQLEALFETQREFHRHGTAELFDLCRTWITWRNLHDAARREPDAVSPSQHAGRESALQNLGELAAATKDRRGRIAADVACVQLLTQLNAVDALRTRVDRDAGYLR